MSVTGKYSYHFKGRGAVFLVYDQIFWGEGVVDGEGVAMKDA